jgi:hypothetical protein
MSESGYCKTWWSQLNQGFDKKKVEEVIVKVTLKMISEEPDIVAIICECERTECLCILKPLKILLVYPYLMQLIWLIMYNLIKI